MQKVIILGGIGNGSVIAQAIADANRRNDNNLEMIIWQYLFIRLHI